MTRSHKELESTCKVAEYLLSPSKRRTVEKSSDEEFYDSDFEPDYKKVKVSVLKNNELQNFDPMKSNLIVTRNVSRRLALIKTKCI